MLVKQTSARPAPFALQGGVSLIELMVGIAIGLLVISVAVGALMVSRNISGTVSDATAIQQQAAYAMRVIGQQVRQAGSLRLNLDPQNTGSDDYLIPVALETVAPADGTGNAFDPRTNTLDGANDGLVVGYRRYKEASYTTADDTSLSRNCLGGPADTSTDQRVESVFGLSGTQLLCDGNGAGGQAIVQNVADFQVRYLRQDNASPSDSKMQLLGATAVGNWSQVQAVDVCLVLYGNEAIDVPAGSTYVGCDGSDVDMTALTGERARRLHLVFRNVFQLRSQGLNPI